MKLQYTVLFAATTILIICLFTHEADARRGGGGGGRGGGSRGSSRGSSRGGSRGSSRSSSSKSRASIARSKTISKIPRARVKLPSVKPLGRRMTSTERIVAWTAIGWYANMRLQRTAHFVNYKCRSRFTECREKVTRQNVTAPSSTGNGSLSDGYCSFLDNSRTCLSRSSLNGDACSAREQEWLRVAACDAGSYDGPVQWNKTSWEANEVLRLSVQSRSERCQNAFERCRSMSSTDSTVKSYCSMIKDKKSCFNDECTSDDLDMFGDAACKRTAVNWEDGYAETSYDLRMSAAVVSYKCQLSFDTCRSQSIWRRNYCNMLESDTTKYCLSKNGCTTDEYETLYGAACGAVTLYVSTFGVLGLLLISLLGQ